MPAFDIIRESTPSLSFRAKQTIDRFEIQSDKVKKRFQGDIKLPDKWNIGLIVGSSGTGKTTIAKELFGDSFYRNQYKGKSVIDDMPEGSVTDIQKMFNSVGFSSPPSWLKPYNVLSNGERMRVDLAAALLSGKELIIFDEFTSVVDRQVAKIGSVCTQKAVRKRDSKFIAVSCHYDIEEWLMPDWVFDTNEMQMKYSTRRYLRHPKLEFRIIKTKEKDYIWRLFGEYHYLSHTFNKSCDLFVAECNGVLCAMGAVLVFPHPKRKNTRQEHRLVVSPDFQGIGIGHQLSSFVGEYYISKGWSFISTTTNPALSYVRQRDNKWILRRQGRVSSSKLFKNSVSANRITLSWEYIG